MPCRVDPTPAEIAEERRRAQEAVTGALHEEISVLKLELQEREAMLCGILTAATCRRCMDDVRQAFDEREAGVTIERIFAWWKEHKRKDEERRQREAADREARKQEILTKLTPEERNILGV